MNLANRISVARIVLVPFFVAAVVYSKLTLAMVIFVISISSDALDGYIARRRSEMTRLGTLLDPIADKLLLISGFISFSAVKSLPPALKFPPYVPLIIISRDVLIILGCLIIYMLKGELKVEPTRLGKVTTFFQMISIMSVLIQFTHSAIFWNIAVLLTVLSGMDYLRIGSKMLNETR